MVVQNGKWQVTLCNGIWHVVIHMGNRLAVCVAVWSICSDVKPFAIIYVAPLAICICHLVNYSEIDCTAFMPT